MLKIKNFTWVLTIIVMSVMLIGCSANEVIIVGTPYNYKGTDAVKFDTEIKDSEEISKLRAIIDKSKKMEKPSNKENVADVFFSIDKPKEGISEMRRYIWFQEDGSAILCDEMANYYTLNKKQTNELKAIFESE